jgi:hypothetical protein
MVILMVFVGFLMVFNDFLMVLGRFFPQTELAMRGSYGVV